MRLSRVLYVTVLALVAAVFLAAPALCAPLDGRIATAPSAVNADQGGLFSLLIKPDGSLWACGDNSMGQLGLGDVVQRRVFTRVGSASDWAAVACGKSHSLALKTDGSLWAWGGNASGQLGLGETTTRTEPVRLGKADNWVAIAAGDGFSLGLRSDGALWAWGANGSGQLGVGDRRARLSPSRVRSGGGWAAVSCGRRHALAVKADGTLWAWGDNAHGQLGLGDKAGRLTPRRIGTSRRWRLPSCGDQYSVALASDGRLWAWGYNADGQLGLRDRAQRLSPRRVGSSTAWTGLSCGRAHTVAVKSGGTLWAWGDNARGQLGLGTTSDRTVPTRVGTGTSWEQALCGRDFTAGFAADASRWAWGDASSGQLGLGDRTSRRSPVFSMFLSDVAAPAVESLTSLTHPDPGAWYAAASPAFSWSASDVSGVAGYACVLDQDAAGEPALVAPIRTGAKTFDVTPDGTWYFHVRAVDGAGNWGPTSTRRVKIDTTGPSITLAAPTQNATYVLGSGATCGWTSSDAASGVAGQSASVDGVPVSRGDYLDALAPGPHSFAVTVTDRVGNMTSLLVPFAVAPPALALTSPNGEENWIRGTHHEIRWRIPDPVTRGSFEILLWTAATGWSKLNDAPIAVDRARTEYSYAWTVDEPATTGCRMRVEYRIGAGDALAWDDSDAAFGTAPALPDPWAGKLVTVGRYAYVAGGGSGLQIYDIRDPADPVLTGVCDTPGAASDVFVIGNCAYVADGASGLAVIDVSDAQRPAFVRELAMPGPAQRLAVSRGRLLERFETPAGWTASGATLSTDSVHVKEGQTALKAAIPPASTGRVMKSDLAWDLSRDAKGVELWVYVQNVGLPPLTQSKSAWLRLYLSNANNFTNTFYASSNATVHEGWNLIRFSPNDWKTFGSPTWSAPIRRIAFDVVTAADSGLEVTLDGLRAGVQGLRPAFLWTLDDGWDEVYREVLPYLSAKGQGATMYVRSDYPDTGGAKITSAHLQSLYDAGWALANHTVDHTQLPTVDRATAAAKIKAGSDWLVARGFTRAANHLAYPFNATSPEAMAAARDGGVLSARGGNNRNVQMPVDEPLLLSSFGFDDTSSPTVALWESRIDRAIASGSTIICCAHRFDATTLPVFQGIADLLEERQMWTPTIDEWWDTLAAQSMTGETVAGRYLYVACGEAGVQVVDITNPLVPTLSGLCATDGSANDVAVDDGYVYAAHGAGELPVIDATLPTDPTLIGSSAVGGSALGIAVSGAYAYLAEGLAGLRIVSIADPSHPVTTATLDTPGVAADVVVAGDRAYVADGAAGVQIVDISDPADPVLVGSRALPGPAGGLVVFGGRVYVAAGSAGLLTASVTQP